MRRLPYLTQWRTTSMLASKSSSNTRSGWVTYCAGLAMATSGTTASHFLSWYSTHSLLIVMSPSTKWKRSVFGSSPSLLSARSMPYTSQGRVRRIALVSALPMKPFAPRIIIFSAIPSFHRRRAALKRVSAGRPFAGDAFMRSVGRDALFSLAALLVSVILVQSLYATVIRPRAAAILAEPAIPQEQLKPGQPAPHNLRSPYVILKDYEQEVALILATWALSLIAYQAAAVARNRRLLDKPYIELGEGHVVLPDDARAYGRPIESLRRPEQEMLLPRALMVALNRFGATRSVQDAAEAVRAECENELDRLDAQLSMVRFTAWAIPAVGFVGTVRGIGRALQEAQGALRGDISGVTLGLGITFNATLTALISCIVVMFCLHQLQQAQDRLVLDARLYIDRRLIRNMRVS